jgi:hypothetical protein
MDPRSIVMALLWLAALGGVVLIATKVVGKTATKAAAAV